MKPQWSPDGRFLVKRGTSKKGINELIVLETSGFESVAKYTCGSTKNVVINTVAWSGDGEKIVFGTDSHECSGFNTVVWNPNSNSVVAGYRLSGPVHKVEFNEKDSQIVVKYRARDSFSAVAIIEHSKNYEELVGRISTGNLRNCFTNEELERYAFDNDHACLYFK